MAVKRIVDTKFWQDSYVMDHYSVEDKYFLLYLMTNPRSSQIGIYSLPKKAISFETGFTTEVVSVLLDRFCNKYGNICYVNETQEITILNSLKYSIVKGGKPVSDLLEKEINAVENSALILNTYKHLKKFWKNSSRPFDKTIRKIFESELVKRKELSIDATLVYQEHNENDNDIDNVNDNDNDNDNEESLVDSSKKLNSKNLDESYQAISYYLKNFGELTASMKKHIISWINKLSDEIVLEAFKRSHAADSPVKYATTILNAWYEKDAHSLKKIEKLDQEHSNQFPIKNKKHKEIIPSWMKAELEEL